MKKKSIPTSFKFWKENKISQEFTLSLEEVTAKFKEWLKTKDLKWLGYYSNYDIACVFVGAKEEDKGLNSAMEMVRGSKNDHNDYEELAYALRKVKADFLLSTEEPKS
jgi:hypothetical protein